MTGERGRRQAWGYDVTFAGGAMEHFVLPCPSVPVHINKECLMASLSKLRRQKFNEDAFKNLAKSRFHINRLLEMKNLTFLFGPSWDLFYKNLPESESDDRFPLLAPKSLLSLWAEDNKREIQVSIIDGVM